MPTLDREVRRVTNRLMKALDTPRSLAIFLMVKYEEWEQLAHMRTDPSHYLDCSSYIEKFRRDYQATEFLRKYPGLPIRGYSLAEAAEDSFLESEKACAVTNLRLDQILDHPVYPTDDHRLPLFIEKVRRTVKWILGPLPDSIQGHFGPGVTFEKEKNVGGIVYHFGHKITNITAVTAGAYSVYRHSTDGDALDRARLAELPDLSEPIQVRGNRFTSVPKDATKNRGICIEPGGNVYCQLGVGSYIKERLKCIADIDFERSQSQHCRMAMEGSVSNDLSTIDLSSASDTVSLNLVKLLLPEEWFDLLYALRSGFTLFKGKWVKLEKFSSMGNGYTFELETLIFYAVSLVSARLPIRHPHVKVYGDDIIVPRSAAQDVLWALRFFGFTPNPRKTFVSGPFRESCGGDFFLGADCTPYRLQEEPNEPHQRIAFANGLWRVSAARTGLLGPFRLARLSVLDSLPSHIRALTGPVGLGDLLVHDFEHRWRTTMRDGIRYFKVWQPVPYRVKLSRLSTGFHLACALYGVRSSGITPRDVVSGYRLRTVPYS